MVRYGSLPASNLVTVPAGTALFISATGVFVILLMK